MIAQQVVNVLAAHGLQIVAVYHAGLGVARIHLADGHAQTRRNVLHALAVLADDAYALGDGLGRDRMIARHHDHLDAGRAALLDGVGDGGARRINHGHEAQEAQVLDGKVDLLVVELVAARVLLRIEAQVTEAEHTLTQTAELQIGVVELTLPEVAELQVGAVHVDGGAALEDSLGRALHDEQVALVTIVGFV